MLDVFTVRQALEAKNLFTVEALRSYSGTPQSVGLLWTSDQPVAQNSLPGNTQYSQEIDIHAPRGTGIGQPDISLCQVLIFIPGVS